MKRKILGLIIASIFLSGCNFSIKKSGIEIMSYPTAKVYLDGKEAGMTPYKNNSLTPGETEVKLVTANQEWTKKIHLENGANTVVNREFGETEEESGGYILYFESTGDNKKSGLMVSSRPDRAAVYIDDEIKGYSPLRIENIGDGDKKLAASFPGYKGINSYVKFVNGYQLVMEAELAKEAINIIEPSTEAAEISTPSGETAVMVTIKETETGWLNVRENANSSGAAIAKINPGEKYKFIEENNGWYKIDLGNGKSGWISAKYAEKP